MSTIQSSWEACSECKQEYNALFMSILHDTFCKIGKCVEHGGENIWQRCATCANNFALDKVEREDDDYEND